jgi:small subunit ribosomal protein S3
MGQKVNPVGYRLGVNKDWDSRWYAKKDYADNLNKDIKIREYILTSLKDASISSVIIERKKNRVEVTIRTAKPGVIIGRGGEDIDALRKKISKLVNEEVFINIVEEKNANLNAKLVADNIALQIENRAPFRAAQKRAIRDTMKAGAKGIKTLVSGRLNGVEMARSEGYTEGTVPLHTIRADIDYAQSEANTTYGKIGVKVWIYKDEILPAKGNKRVEKKEATLDVNAKEN